MQQFLSSKNHFSFDQWQSKTGLPENYDFQLSTTMWALAHGQQDSKSKVSWEHALQQSFTNLIKHTKIYYPIATLVSCRFQCLSFLKWSKLRYLKTELLQVAQK